MFVLSNLVHSMGEWLLCIGGLLFCQQGLHHLFSSGPLTVKDGVESSESKRKVVGLIMLATGLVVIFMFW